MNKNVLAAAIFTIATLFLATFAYAANSPPTFAALPTVTVQNNEGAKLNLISLTQYASDQEDADDQLLFRIVSQSNAGLISCYLNTGSVGAYANNVSCNTPANSTGTNQIVLEVEDKNAATARSTLNVNVAGTSNSAPVISIIDSVEIEENSGEEDRIVDFWSYVSDDHDSDSELSFSITQTDASLIFCFVESDRYLSCDEPEEDETGTNVITLSVRDSANNLSTSTFNVRVENDNGNSNNSEPDLRSLPNIFLEENDDEQDELIDLWDYAFDDEDDVEDLTYKIISQSDTGLIFCRITSQRYVSCEAPNEDDTGSSTVTVQVRDTDGETDSDSFEIEVGSGSDGVCSDIRMDTSTEYISEDEVETISFDVENRNSRDFRIISIDASDDSQYLRINEIDFPETIDSDDSVLVEIELESQTVSGNREALVTVQVVGEFANGKRCSFSDTRKSFRVVVQNNGNSGSSNAICDDLRIEAPDITIEENSRESHSITLVNENEDRSFSVDSIQFNEDSSDFSISRSTSLTSVPREDEREIEFSVRSESVSRDETESVEVRVAGRFSNGRYCSLSSITEEFDVTVDEESDSGNNGGNGNGNENPQPVDPPRFVISNVPKTITGETKIVLRNSGDDLKNISISVINAPSAVNIGTITKGTWYSGEEVLLDVKPNNFEGIVHAIVRVEADSGSASAPLDLNITKMVQATNDDATGLVGLATTAGMALGVLIVIVLAIAGLVSIVFKK